MKLGRSRQERWKSIGDVFMSELSGDVGIDDLFIFERVDKEVEAVGFVGELGPESE